MMDIPDLSNIGTSTKQTIPWELEGRRHYRSSVTCKKAELFEETVRKVDVAVKEAEAEQRAETDAFEKLQVLLDFMEDIKMIVRLSPLE